MSIPQNVITVTAVLPLSPLPCHPLLQQSLQLHGNRNLFPPLLTFPYITVLGYLKLGSFKHHRMEASEKFFDRISQADSSSPPPSSASTRHSTCDEIAARKDLSYPTHQNKTILFFHQMCTNITMYNDCH